MKNLLLSARNVTGEWPLVRHAALLLVVSFGCAGCADEEFKGCPPATPTKYARRTITAAELKPILTRHREWLNAYDHDDDLLQRHWTDERRADLSGADLTGLADEEKPEDRNCLVQADLEWVDLHEAKLVSVNMTGADLTNANLRRADLEGTVLSGAELSDADLACALFEPSPGDGGASNGLPQIGSLALAKNLFLLSFHDSPHGLSAIRDALQKSGDREQERQVTFALNYEARRRDMGHQRPNTSRQDHQKEPSWWEAFQKNQASFVGGTFNWIAFELPAAYGLQSGRPLKILLLLIIAFAIPYSFAIVRPTAGGGIFKVWPKDGLETKEESREEVRFSPLTKPHHRSLYNILKFALFFSAASAFQIGWHDLNVGNWIDRLHAHEYTLRAVGWPRTLAGLQAIVSGFLLALWVLCYFGRPFG